MTYSVLQLKPNIYHIADPMGVFMTLILGEEKAMLLDTGYGLGHLDKTVAQLTDLPVILVNSHGHLDHVLGNRFFDEAYLHPADFDLYHEHTMQARRQAIVGLQTIQPELFPADFSAADYLAEFKTKIIPINEGDVIDLGGVRLTVYLVPGHTAGGIALVDDRDRLLFSGDAISPHVWMLLEESTSIATYIQSLQKLKNLSAQYDAIVAAHVPDLLPNEMIDRLIHCAENIAPENSVPFEPPFDDIEKGLMYFEGLDALKESLNLETLDLATQPFHLLNLEGVNFAEVPFVSITYNESKL